MRFSKHYLALALAIALGAALRFALLDFKPLWLDEVLTALFSQGRSYSDIPLDAVFPVSRLEQIFALNPQASCGQIAHTLVVQSTHPPVFFCLMHRWLDWIDWPLSLAWKMRSLSVLFGIGAIAAVYLLARVAFSPIAGLWAAAVMAVSPFGVYLSQEARHYSLPVLICALALSALVQIQKDFHSRDRQRPLLWVAWIAANTLGLYIHYFFLLAFIAQLVTLIFDFKFSRSQGSQGEQILQSGNENRDIRLPNYKISFRNNTLSIFICISPKYISICLLPVALFAPWLPILLGHFGRSETSWIPRPENIAPIYQTFATWMTVSVMLPVENQPLWIIIPGCLAMIIFASWLGWRAFLGLRQLLNQPETHRNVRTLVSFTLWVLLQFAAIVYLLGKDITIVPRYHFLYYPAMCVLLGAGLEAGSQVKIGEKEGEKSNSPFLNFLLNPNRQALFYTVLVTGVLSCIVVVSDLGYRKAFHPREVAQNMNVDSAVPVAVVVGYKNFQDVGLGLSFALELHERDREGKAGSSMAFLQRSRGYERVWQNLSQLENLPAPPLNLWVVAPEIRRADYPARLLLSQESQQGTTCHIDSAHYHRIGVPYQLYRCDKKSKK